jgi:hypothetical protein
MKKCANELNRVFSKKEVQIDKTKQQKKNPYEIKLNIPGHKGNTNQNHINILPHPHSC